MKKVLFILVILINITLVFSFNRGHENHNRKNNNSGFTYSSTITLNTTELNFEFNPQNGAKQEISFEDRLSISVKSNFFTFLLFKYEPVIEDFNLFFDICGNRYFPTWCGIIYGFMHIPPILSRERTYNFDVGVTYDGNWWELQTGEQLAGTIYVYIFEPFCF